MKWILIIGVLWFLAQRQNGRGSLEILSRIAGGSPADLGAAYFGNDDFEDD